jgi:hypothetical protein
MIDDKTKDLYNSIKAPEALRERVLLLEAQAKNTSAKSASTKKPLVSQRVLRPLLASAASFAIILTAVFFTVMSRSPAALIVGGNEIAGSPIEIIGFSPMGMRINLDVPIDDRAMLTFALDGEGENTITVTQGDLSDNADGDEHVEDVRKLTVNGNAQVTWRIAPGTYASMTIGRGVQKETYDLNPVGESGVWTITKMN